VCTQNCYPRLIPSLRLAILPWRCSTSSVVTTAVYPVTMTSTLKPKATEVNQLPDERISMPRTSPCPQGGHTHQISGFTPFAAVECVGSAVVVTVPKAYIPFSIDTGRLVRNCPAVGFTVGLAS
jgi:hypothetical protein